jgi:hypothetical protein
MEVTMLHRSALALFTTMTMSLGEQRTMDMSREEWKAATGQLLRLRQDCRLNAQ